MYLPRPSTEERRLSKDIMIYDIEGGRHVKETHTRDLLMTCHNMTSLLYSDVRTVFSVVNVWCRQTRVGILRFVRTLQRASEAREEHRF